MKSWFTNYFSDRGSYHLSVEEEPEYEYLLISAGYIKDGGYSLDIVEVAEEEESITFKVKLSLQAKERLNESQVYPNLLIKVNTNGKKLIVNFIDYKENFCQNTRVIENIIEVSASTVIETVKGIFINRINDNYIKMQSGEDLLNLKFSLNSEHAIGNLTRNAAISVAYIVNESEELEVCSLGVGIWPGVPLDSQPLNGTGAFIEFQENHSCLISENGEEVTYWIAEEVINNCYTWLKKDDEVKFYYYIDSYYRKVILDFID